MAENTKIEWADHTFNPWIGCTEVSKACTGGGGCDRCYAKVSTPVRVLRNKGIETWGPGAQRVRTKTWGDPVKWNKQHEAFYAKHGRRQRVFCASLADVFDNEVDPQWRADLFDLIRRCENLDFLLLTKRVGNVTRMLQEVASILRSENGAQAERELGVQAGPVGGAGDRHGGPNLARGEANLRPLDRWNEGDTVRAGTGGAEDAPGLPAGAGHDRWEAALCGCGAVGLASLQGSYTARADGQPQGRSEGPESPGQLGTGDVQRAAAACGAGAGCWAPRREGLEAPQGAGDGSGRTLNAPATGSGLEGEGHRGAVRDNAERRVAGLPRQDLDPRTGLLGWIDAWLAGNPPPNVWLGATIVNQAEADRDIPKLLQVPARVRFLSMEPLLGAVDIKWALPDIRTACCHRCGFRTNQVGGACPNDGETLRGDVGIDWVIVGGESGHHARPMHPDWARSLRDQCQAAGVPFLFKQHGEWREVEGDYQLSPEDATAEGYDPKTDCVVTPDGRIFNKPEDLPDDVLGRWMERVGKKAAGRLLDGRTWDGFPA